ncbi:alpha-galactosidase [Colletotrichum cuscutae]|uniref:alpha-galactosidase n=1 Tax=Colletotrichum cuscutae TaxID=1209917 RepID=A0AAI9UZD0_9PEZI|nr:alpha-galactosidase [Colletotrichum cuscutae]
MVRDGHFVRCGYYPCYVTYTDALKIDFLVNNAGVICLDRILPPTVEPSPHSSPNFEFSKLPLVSIRMSGEGSGDIKTAKTLIGTTLSDRLRYQSHRIIKSDDGSNETLIVECSDNTTNMDVGDEQAAFAAIIDYRRQIRRPHNDMERMPIIFDDYMNCFMGDPDGNKVYALLEPVGQLGAEYFVIDAGWYADDGNWWDGVGLWELSTKRFPSGFMKLMGEIRNKGLIPGLWLEPEVVSVRSPVGSQLPNEAFFQDGHRVVEKRQWTLDHRHPEVIVWMNKVIHNLIDHYGAECFKFDYNIDVLQGTDVGGQGTAGAAHLEHQRAYLGWIRALLDNDPGVLIETCSGRANRLDYAMLAVHSIQFTSNQQDPKLYAAIAAACPTAPGCSDKLNALSLVNSMMGRVDLLRDNQLAIVKEGLEVYESMRGDLRHVHLTSPLGLPKWHDDWVALTLT